MRGGRVILSVNTGRFPAMMDIPGIFLSSSLARCAIELMPFSEPHILLNERDALVLFDPHSPFGARSCYVRDASFVSAAMSRGVESEDELRSLFEVLRNNVFLPFVDERSVVEIGGRAQRLAGALDDALSRSEIDAAFAWASSFGSRGFSSGQAIATLERVLLQALKAERRLADSLAVHVERGYERLRRGEFVAEPIFRELLP